LIYKLLSVEIDACLVEIEVVWKEGPGGHSLYEVITLDTFEEKYDV